MTIGAGPRSIVESRLGTCPTCPPLYAALVDAHQQLSELRDPDTVTAPDLEAAIRTVLNGRETEPSPNGRETEPSPVPDYRTADARSSSSLRCGLPGAGRRISAVVSHDLAGRTILNQHA